MNRYIVEYQNGLDEPEFFVCEADDSDHAVEQTANAYPDVQIIAIWTFPAKAAA